MFTVEVSPQAAQDLLEIKNYIEKHFGMLSILFFILLVGGVILLKYI